ALLVTARLATHACSVMRLANRRQEIKRSSMPRSRLQLAVSLLTLSLLLVGCGSAGGATSRTGSPTATASPTATPSPTVTPLPTASSTQAAQRCHPLEPYGTL